MERHSARAFGNERQHDVACVAVREALAGRKLARVAVEHREVVLGGRELVHRYRHHVLLDLESGFLVEVVADARPVRQEVLNRHAVVDQRQIATEDGAGERRELEHAFLDQAHDGERREAFRPARDSEARVDRVRDLEAAMRKAVRPRELDPVAFVDPNDTREPSFGRKGVELASEIRHAADASG